VRTLQVRDLERITPGMLRITFIGQALSDFVSLAPDDHVKLLVPAHGGGTERRSYTPRRYDAIANTLTIDFAVHDAGPATQWALNARPGDTLQVSGPKSSFVLTPEIRHWVLVGDETGLPAIGRRIEEAAPGTRITSVVAVAGAPEQQVFDTAAELTALWAHRPLSAAHDPAPLLSMVRTIEPRSDTFVWIAAEAQVARVIRGWFIDAKRHPKSWLKAGGYWVAGRANGHDRLDY
jgi:NADPH-dependent ferric siderophore reductase